ncbi:hypothetical protein [Paenibacillus harenae]|uniref:DUF2716 domain-containing protein n=1 Tax=Paenibacillus harenae TaxID=306543 RepID=A0ABT9UDY1_PAEHA|nr:hypothetical protein [Paenibacillus harenae]MDQ0116624.1 hypothetical protein [Paenibacillus harenae]
MTLHQLSNEEFNKIKEKLRQVWDYESPFWYPLDDCIRNDIIAFDSKFVQTQEKLEFIKVLLKKHKVTCLFQLREDGKANKIDDIEEFNFWNSDDYFWNNDCFWFDQSMDWVLYLSHEQTITFGGEWIIEAIKNEWIDWKENISWDTKNK